MAEKNGLPKPPKEAAEAPRKERFPGDDGLTDKVAAALEKMGGGSIAIVGHTDVRASHAYNLALGMRRAKAVYEALAQRLSPQVRANVRVEASNDPTAPVGVRK